MKRILIVIACLLSLPLTAKHIVGGEFELLHISGNQYRLNLIYYFDVVANPNRIPEDEERNIEVFIFRKSNDALMRSVILAFQFPKVRVGYTQPECSTGEIVTDKLIYTAVIVLSEQDFADPMGYYISWERCCRNYGIVNIVSDDPMDAGTPAGQTFYLEFPAVVKNGQPFINSSPRLFPPLNDYACTNKPYYVDFAGIDDDGDSLVYSLADPLDSHDHSPLPAPSARPYPTVTWLQNISHNIWFDLTAIINGLPARPENPDLRISYDGFIRVTPRHTGLFVFAVKVEEFRNQEKIGESRRDFQMLVVDCRESSPPVIVGKKLTDATFSTAENMSLTFSAAVPDEERCIIVSVSDPDALREADIFSEVIRLKAVPLNFNGKHLPELLPATSTAIIHNDETAEFRICFPRCPYFEGGAYQIGIIAFDDACALPLSDTLKVAVSVEPPPNAPVEFVTGNVNAVLNEGDSVAWDFEARDADGDPLIMTFMTNGFVLTTAGITIEESLIQEPGVLRGRLTWSAYCNIYDFTNRTSFQVTVMVDDNDPCDFNDPAVMTFDLAVLLPGNAYPVADTGLTLDLQETVVKDIPEVQLTVLQQLSFEVTGKDLVDNDPVTIRMAGRDFKPSDYGMTFQKKSGVGSVASNFSWDLACDKVDPTEKDLFELLFIAIDSTNKCRINERDTVHVVVDVARPLNSPPTIAVASLNPNVPYNDGDMHIVIGEPIQLSFIARDNDTAPADELTIDLVAVNGTATPEGFVFTPAKGASPQTAILEWSPDCTIFDFESEVLSNDYTFTFIYADNHCQTAVADTVEVAVNVSDILTQDFELEPPNVFTPNGDEINDYFSMSRRQGEEIVNLLPPDNCVSQFQNVRIYNRWGTSVFESTDRNFRWTGGVESAGVYYYFVKYTNREYKGTVSLRN